MSQTYRIEETLVKVDAAGKRTIRLTRREGDRMATRYLVVEGETPRAECATREEAEAEMARIQAADAADSAPELSDDPWGEREEVEA